jgi:hypothetical protein
MTDAVSEIFDPAAWTTVPGFDFTDITYHRANDVEAASTIFSIVCRTNSYISKIFVEDVLVTSTRNLCSPYGLKIA